MAVRRSQESLELGVKALLRYVGVEYPREHDVGPVLRDLRERLPEAFRGRVDETAELVSELAEKRGLALYGDEQSLIPSSRVFGEEYAETVYRRVEATVLLVAKILL